MSTVRHYHHHFHFSYTTSLKRHFISTIGVLVFLIILIIIVYHSLAPSRPIPLDHISFGEILFASVFTLYRLSIAYFFSIIVSIPLALLITSSPSLEKYLLPIVDILQSVPVLAFFPLIVLGFVNIGLFEGAAIFILFLGMMWNLVFSMIGGLKTIPADIKSTAIVFQATGFKKLVYITLPSILPYIITGSLLAWGQGWNIIIVAEVLHTYIPNGTTNMDLFGLGSVLVNATYLGRTGVFISALVAMVILIGIINFFIWQKLIHLTERYKFD